MASSKVFATDSATSRKSRLVTALKTGIDAAADIKTPDGLFGFTAAIETDKTVLKNSDFDFEFDIPFDDDTVPNEAEIIIYNMSAATLGNFKKGNALSVTAGYGTDTGIILNGIISSVKTVHDGCDKVTTVTVLDNADYEDAEIVEETYAEGTTASAILKALLEKLTLPVAVFTVGRDHTYDKSTAVKGSITEAIKKYADVCGVSVYVCKQQIYCRPIWDGDNAHFTICEATGLIGSPEPFEESTTSEEYVDSVTGYEMSMLLQYRMTTAAIADVSSRDYSGRYRVISGSHTYDGLSAVTEIKAIENITTTIEETTTTSTSTSTSSTAERIMQIAEAEIGTAETGTNNVKYNTWYYGGAVNGSAYPWCAVFVSWCLNQAGITNYKSASAGYFASCGTYHSSGYTPKRGDLFLVNYSGGYADHIGFVQSCSGSTFTTVEGNSSDMVRSRTRNVSEFTFVTPPY